MDYAKTFSFSQHHISHSPAFLTHNVPDPCQTLGKTPGLVVQEGEKLHDNITMGNGTVACSNQVTVGARRVGLWGEDYQDRVLAELE